MKISEREREIDSFIIVENDEKIINLFIYLLIIITIIVYILIIITTQ
jgi:hypothetical protein